MKDKKGTEGLGAEGKKEEKKRKPIKNNKHKTINKEVTKEIGKEEGRKKKKTSNQNNKVELEVGVDSKEERDLCKEVAYLSEKEKKKIVHLNRYFGQGYGAFVRYKGRYRVVKGGRASKKSTNALGDLVIKMILMFHKYGAKPNVLVLRMFYNTHKDSTFSQLLWCINILGFRDLFSVKLSPLEITYKPSGTKFLFRGMDKPDSVTSIRTEVGDLCWTYWEEAYQIQDEQAFDRVDMSIRGEMHPMLWKQHTLVMNPWSDKTWIKKRFFDKVNKDGLSADGNIMAITRNYDCNEFLDIEDISLFETMRIENPRRFRIEGLGEWGISEGQVYTNYKVMDFDVEKLYAKKNNRGDRLYKLKLGLDFGYSIDPAAFIAILVDEKNYKLYVFAEMYKTKLTNLQIAQWIKKMGFSGDRIWADSADPRTINELYMLGIGRIKGVKKGGKMYKEAAALVIQDYEIIIHPNCENFQMEIENYVYAKDRQTGKTTNRLADEYDHLMDAMIYALNDIKSRTFSFSKDLVQ